MKQSESIAKLATALFKAQHEIKGATKDATNPFFKSKYADLESVWEAVKTPLYENQLSVLQPTSIQDGVFGVVTILLHSSGEYISGFTPVNAKDNSAQAMGSGISYSRRYALASILGVYQRDDDGNDASKGVNSDFGQNDEAGNDKNAFKQPQTAQGSTQNQQSMSAPKKLSDAQIKRLWAISKKAGHDQANVCAVAAEQYGVTNFHDLSYKDYQSFCDWLEKTPPSESLPF